MSKNITSDWIEWVNVNIERGCDKDGIFKILLDEGFELKSIIDSMGYIPIANPALRVRSNARSRYSLLSFQHTSKNVCDIVIQAP